MFQDEAGFGRINKPKYCWAEKGVRPSVPCHHIREYRYAYGTVEPNTGDSFFLILPYNNTVCMNLFLKELSCKYCDDIILVVCEIQFTGNTVQYRVILPYSCNTRNESY